MSVNHWTGKVKISGEQISQIFKEFHQPKRFEDHVEAMIAEQLPERISREDYLTYIGTLSCLLWVDRAEYQENPPKSITINQKPNGCFKSRIQTN